MSTANCYVDFWENKEKDGSHDGGHHRFDGPLDVSDLSNNYWDGENQNTFNEMDDSISSLSTGSQAWVKLFSQHNYGGSTYLVQPNTNIPDLSTISMDNTIVSFQLFDAQPIDVNNVLQNFLNLYPGSNYLTKLEGQCIEFYAQDAHYRIYYPTITQSGNTVSFEINIDHDRGGGTDDHATVNFAIDTAGKFNGQITVSYDMSDGAYHVPQFILDLIDDGIDDLAEEIAVYLDGAEIVLTDGVGFELVIPTDAFIYGAAELLTTCVNHTNDLIDYLFGLTDDGGTMYFQCIVGQAIARLSTAYYQELFYGANTDLLSFNENAFLNQFGQTSWQTDKNNPYVNFSNNGSSYRSYFPDNTFCYSKAGLVSSVKIDAINDNAKDDHLIMFAVFDPTGKLFSVQGGIDIYGAPDDSDDTDNYTAPNSGIIAYNNQGQIVQITNKSTVTVLNYDSLEDAYKAKMQAALSNVQYVDTSNFSDALNNVVNASCEVLDAIKAAIAA